MSIERVLVLALIIPLGIMMWSFALGLLVDFIERIIDWFRY